MDMRENITGFTRDLNVTASVTTELFRYTNATTSRTPVPRTPPPIGYYGDTRELLWKVVTPVIITWGTLGNLLTIIVLMRQVRKISSTAMYLLALAFSDTCVLWCGPFRNWMKYMWDIDVRYLNDVGCRFQLYLTYGCMHFSSWLLVMVTLERTIGVVSPYKVKSRCTPRNAGIVIASIFVFVFGIDLVIPIITALDGYQPLKGQDPVKCGPSTKAYTEFRDNIWQWIDLSLSFLLPFACLIIGNALIIGNLQKSKRNQRVMRVSRGKGGRSTVRDTWSVTVLTIALCVIFFLTMTPVAVFQIYYPYRYDELRQMFFEDPFKAWECYQYLLLQHTIVNLVSYTNASFNFVLYVFSGTKFRAELKALLCCSTDKRRKLFTSLISASSLKTQSISSKKSLKTVDTKMQHSEKHVDQTGNGYIHTLGIDNLVFTDDSEVSSISSIFAKRKADDTNAERTASENNENSHGVFDDAAVIITSCDTQTSEGLDGFYLHL